MWENAGAAAIAWLPRCAAAVVLLLLFFAIARFCGKAVLRLGRKADISQNAVGTAESVVQSTIFALGVITALGTLGVDITALVAGLGLAGFAVGFALKDIVANVVAGILIFFYRPFREGDVIEVLGVKGTVVRISLRYTRLDLLSGESLALIPNANLFSNPLIIRKPQQVP